MTIRTIQIPQLGEGLVEVRIVRLLKQPGARVRRDEPIYTMETDKAEVDIECPLDGVLQSWAVSEDDIVAIGGVVARIAVDSEDEPPTTPSHGGSETAGTTVSGTSSAGHHSVPRNAQVPPRTRAYAKERGLSAEELGRIPAASAKLTPADVDR